MNHRTSITSQIASLLARLSLGIAIVLALFLTTVLQVGQINADETAPAVQAPEAGAAADKTRPEPATKAEATPVEVGREREWLDSLGRGYVEAQKEKRPILLRGGSVSCPFCELLEVEIAKPEVQEALRSWTLVYLDIDKSQDDARRLGIAGIPALRAMTPFGSVIESHDGMLHADKFVIWLRDAKEKAKSSPIEELLDEAPPDLAATLRLIDQFQTRDSLLREASIRRLLPHPQVAADAVVSAFAKGSLATRLAGMELLTTWKAPIDGLDPWQPATFNPERLKQLSDWVAAAKFPTIETAKVPAALTDEERKNAIGLIDKMIAGDEREAQAIREQLTRFRQSLLPDVVTRLKVAETDVARERLSVLRYRLVATDQLVLRWPGGLERLGSSDAEERQLAADELAKLATANDEPLLLELFSDPVPLVREIALRALRNVGSTNVSGSLASLLSDPDPNVRAAVLKVLSEKPSPQLLNKIAEYAAKESDNDLVLHAVRVLREMKSKESLERLKGFLSHSSWQVRAEAAEGIGKLLGPEGIVRYSSSANDEQSVLKADGYSALVPLLKDSDKFVISRAVEALSSADLPILVEPMLEVANTHPDLAGPVIAALSQNVQSRVKLIPHFRKFCKHDNAAVRSAAIKALCQLDREANEEVQAALVDSDSSVRIAAADAVVAMIPKRASNQFYGAEDDASGVIDIDDNPPLATGNPVSSFLRNLFGPASAEPRPAEPEKKADSTGDASPRSVEPSEVPKAEKSEPKVDEGDTATKPFKLPSDAELDAQLLEIRAGKNLKPWMFELTKVIEPMLQSALPDERIAGATALAALGRDALAIPVLRETLASNPALIKPTMAALPWLLWSDRLDLFRRLISAAVNDDDRGTVIRQVSIHGDHRIETVLWDLLAEPNTSVHLVDTILDGLKESYFPNHSYSPNGSSVKQKKRAAAAAIQPAKSGTKWQRVASWAILLPTDPNVLPEILESVIANEKEDALFRADAMRVLLLAESAPNRKKIVLKAISSPQRETRKVALEYLAFGLEGIATSPDGIRWTYDYSGEDPLGEGNFPEGLDAESMVPLLADADAKTAAMAGYVLCMLEHAEGLPMVLRYWEANAQTDYEWTKLLYRSIAAVHADDRINILERIYEIIRKEGEGGDESSLSTMQMRASDFYWTIRPMKGPRLLALRKKIRDEVGSENLGNGRRSGGF